MLMGCTGQIAHVNLNLGRVTINHPDENWYRLYVGGRAIGAYYLLRDTSPGIDPLGPDNVLVFATSVVTGHPFPGNARASVVGKSPLTGGFGESEAGGWFGPELKFAGFDAIVIKGRAARPVFLYVHDGVVELKDATHLWGLTTAAAEKAIKAELGEKVKVACIGPAGERLVRYACITAGAHNVFGRLGLGAVMGAKNVKAVAVRGTNALKCYDSLELKKQTLWFAENFNRPETCQLFYKYGTAGGVNIYDRLGSLPTHNFRDGTIEGAYQLSAEYMQEQGLMVGKTGCFGCPVACRKMARIEEPAELATGGEVHSPEYETIAALGSNCGITDPRVVIKAGQLCDLYGLDTISTGVTVAFAMECVERKVLDRNVLGEVPLEFGNGQALLECIEQIARRQGIGNLMAEGTKRMSAKLGGGSEAWAVQGKGQELALQDPRGKKMGAAIGYAVAPHGGDHIQMEHDFQFAYYGPFLRSMEPLGVIRPVDADSLGAEKVKLFTLNQCLWSLYNVLDICIFVAAPGHAFSLPRIEAIVKAVTGWETSLFELMRVGKRALTMTRIFNVREGFTTADDIVPKRLTEPLRNGACKGLAVNPEELQRAVRLYYGLMGWDPNTGIPLEASLYELDLDWLIGQF